MIRTVINSKERSIYYTDERLSYLSKHELISDEKSVSRVKRAREVMNERRNNEQFNNKDTSLNVSINISAQLIVETQIL